MEYISETTDQLMVGIMQAGSVDRILEMCRRADIPVMLGDSAAKRGRLLGASHAATGPHTEIVMDMAGAQNDGKKGRIRCVLIHPEGM